MEIKQSVHMVGMTDQRRSKGRKASHKTMPPSKIGIPEFRDEIINASSRRSDKTNTTHRMNCKRHLLPQKETRAPKLNLHVHIPTQ